MLIFIRPKFWENHYEEGGLKAKKKKEKKKEKQGLRSKNVDMSQLYLCIRLRRLQYPVRFFPS